MTAEDNDASNTEAGASFAGTGGYRHVSVLPLLSLVTKSLRKEIVDVLEFMDRAYREPLKQHDIAAAAGLSPRRLQEVFRAAVSKTPTEVLRQIRMLHVRKILLDPKESRSIKQIALEAQISHLGRFSERYADAFGELPSATIASVRVRVRSQRERTTQSKPALPGYFDSRAMEYRRGPRPGPTSE